MAGMVLVTSPTLVTAQNKRPEYWAAPVVPEERKREFYYGFCDCCGECGVCVYGSCCLPCLMSENSARMDGGSPCCCFYPGGPVKNRLQAKAQFGIRLACGGCFGDCLAASCLPCCSEIQIKREIDRHITGQANVQTVTSTAQTPYVSYAQPASPQPQNMKY